MLTLAHFPYHRKINEHFKMQTKTWDYFSANKRQETDKEQFKSLLLKNTYKFDPVADPLIYDKAAIAKEKLGLTDMSVTFYQQQHSDEINASVFYFGTEVHVLFSGPIVQLLNENELLAVIAHELSHIKFYSLFDGELAITDRIIQSIANNYRSEPVYLETARLFSLYTEIFCDRGAFLVVGDVLPVISSLVKVATGLQSVNAASYIKQTDEIFNSEQGVKTAGLTHPENFIRAKAIQLWQDNPETANEAIIQIIEGSKHLDHLDLLTQQAMAVYTRKFIQLFLKPKWFQSPIVINLAKQYFDDFRNDPDLSLTDDFIALSQSYDTSIKEYLAFILLDFVLADQTLEDIPAGWAFRFSETVGIKDTFESSLQKQLKLSDRRMKEYTKKAFSAWNDVKENDSEQIYQD